MTTPEALAHQNSDTQLAACGWLVQDEEAVMDVSLERAEDCDGRY
jgi:hypothetical protein